jgi:tetratricopeptide (TPR) repeat protein
LLDYVLMALDGTFLMQEKYDEEISFFSDYLGRYPRDSMAYCARAAAFWYSDQLQRATEDYSHVLELKPDHIFALSGRGQVLAEMGESRRALDDLDLALRLLKTPPSWLPGNAESFKHIEAFVHRGRGDALATLGDKNTALDEYDLSLTLSPENAWSYYSRARLYELIGDREKALSDYKTALVKKGPALNPTRRERVQIQLRNVLN